jgi:hypothetical protein
MTEIRPRRAAFVLLSALLVVATAACSSGGDKKTNGSTESTPPSIPLTTEATATTTTTAALTKEALLLAGDGLGPLKFGTNAAHTIARLMQALGPPEKNTPLPAGTTCAATRRLQWGNLQVLTNEVGASSGAGKPGFGGWFLGAAGTPLGLKTEKGIGIGSAVAQIKAAYGAENVSIARGEQGPGFNITVPGGIILGQLDALTDAGKVKNIQAGNYCGPA